MDQEQVVKTYSKVNMWDKRGKGGNEGVAGQMPNPNPSAEAKGWGVPTQPNQPTNRPPSPKSWGELSQSSRPVADNGTSGWGSKSVQGEKWDKSGNGLSGNWNQPKPSATGWGQSNDQQWSQTDSGSGWGQPIGKVKNDICIFVNKFYQSLVVFREEVIKNSDVKYQDLRVKWNIFHVDLMLFLSI